MAQAANTAASSTVNLKWRVVDIAVASVIGVASALIYWLVALLTAAPWTALDAIVPGLPGCSTDCGCSPGPWPPSSCASRAPQCMRRLSPAFLKR